MKKAILIYALIIGLFVSQLQINIDSQAQTTQNRVLILYDATLTQQSGKMGLIYAIMLRNLLGHFNLGVDISPVETYTAGKVESYLATFYFGSYYDNPVPTTFLSDVNKTQKRVVWF